MRGEVRSKNTCVSLSVRGTGSVPHLLFPPPYDDLSRIPPPDLDEVPLFLSAPLVSVPGPP